MAVRAATALRAPDNRVQPTTSQRDGGRRRERRSRLTCDRQPGGLLRKALHVAELSKKYGDGICGRLFEGRTIIALIRREAMMTLSGQK